MENVAEVCELIGSGVMGMGGHQLLLLHCEEIFIELHLLDDGIGTIISSYQATGVKVKVTLYRGQSHLL